MKTPFIQKKNEKSAKKKNIIVLKCFNVINS
jgi:hypothetical protein